MMLSSAGKLLPDSYDQSVIADPTSSSAALSTNTPGTASSSGSLPSSFNNLVAPTSSSTATSTASLTALPTSTPMASLSSVEEGSSTSHASSSRLGASSSTTHASNNRLLYLPLSLADALMRANHDETRALDEVLAERNKLCLEATKLGTENVRIWSLMKKMRKENEDFKTASKSAVPLMQTLPANPPLSPSVSSSAATGVTARTSTEGTRASTPPNASMLGVGSHSSSSSKGSSLALPFQTSYNSSGGVLPPLGSGGSTNLRSLKGSDPAISAMSYIAPSSPLSNSVSAPPSAAHFGTFADSVGAPADSATSVPVAPTSPSPVPPPQRGLLQSPQQTSIMQQRAAAQAQRLAAMASPTGDDGSSGRNSLASHDFEAIDGSSVANSDEEEDGGSHNVTGVTSLAGPSGKEEYSRDNVRAGANKRSSSSTYDQRGLSSDSFVRAPSSASPRLDETMLAHVNVAVVGTNLRANERGREDVSFYVSVDLRAPPTGLKSNMTVWRVEKSFSDFVALDGRLKQKHGKSKNAAKRISSVPLPDPSLLKDHAPSKVDQRKVSVPGEFFGATVGATGLVTEQRATPKRQVMLEVYLQNLLSVPLPDKDDLCTFLCTDAVPAKVKDPNATTKEGFLTKKGLNLGRWVTRLYVLSGATLHYYETRGGPHLGSINITSAQIGRQQRSAAADMDENSYRHAFLILEAKPAIAPGEQKQMIRHVLCAESDEERDDWVDVLVRAIAATANAPANDATERTSPQRSNTAPSASIPTSPTTPTMRKTALHERKNSGSSRGGHREMLSSDFPNGNRSIRSPRQAPRSMETPQSQYSQYNTSPTGSNPASSSGPSGPMSGSEVAPSQSGSGPFSTDDHVGNSGLKLMGAQQYSRSRPSTQEHTAGSPSGTATANDVGSSSLHLPESTSSASGVSSLGKERGSARPAISGPMNGTPIPTGYKFGGKDEAGSSGTDSKKRFWHRFGGASSADKSSQPKKVFGVSLAESIAVSNVSEGLELPSVVYRCIEFLEKRNAAMEEGIYRLSGSSAVIKSLRDRFNAQGDVNLLAPSEPFYDPHAIAGLLKQFLRELTNSVLTRELHFDFMRVNEITDRKERVNELGHLVSLLPLANYSLLRTLCSHLIKVIELSHVNKMTMRNVGIVFSPTLGIPAGVFALFLTEFDWVFFTDAQGEPAPKQMEEDIIAPDYAELGIHDPSSLPEGADSIAQEQHDSSSQQLEPPQSPVRPSRKGHNNRSSWIAGNALHSGDGRVMMSLANRDNRNSLSYNESEADKLLGGPQGKYRLSSHLEDMDAGMPPNSTVIPGGEPGGEGQELDREESPEETPAWADDTNLSSPFRSALQLQGSPRTSSRKLQNHNNLTLSRSAIGFDASPSIPNTPTSPTNSSRTSRSNQHSSNPRAGVALQNVPGAVQASSSNDGY